MLPGLANKTTLFTVCDERWGGEYIMVHKRTRVQLKVLFAWPL